MIAYFAYFVFYFLRLRRKLQSTGDEALPPRESTTA
jgi:hypothetical protein